jgi:hypothetical protein
MYQIIKKYRILFNHLIITTLLIICNTVYSQIENEKGTFTNISPGTFLHLKDTISLFSGYSTHKEVPTLIPARILKDRTHLLLDSIKSRAYKGLITKRLYDFIIVSNVPVNNKQIIGNSDISYRGHTGKKIRKIEIQRLNVFGAKINTPAYYNPNRVETILNKTHINTNELIIRKNLLFSEGDTLSPLILSDNERLLRQLSFIDDARIIIVPASNEEVDIIVITKDVYSLGVDFRYKGLKNGSFAVFEKNIFGIGHELGLDVPYDASYHDSPGIGIHYNANNISKTFIDLNLFFKNGLGESSYGFDLTRNLLSATTKYAGGISVRNISTTEDLDSLTVPEPLRYNLQDYWLSRSILIDKESVSRIIIGARYTNNNVFERPYILPYSYYNLQKYRIFLGTAAFSIQKYYKTNLIYGYGHTEDIPYGGLLRLTAGKEINEFKERTYLGADVSFGKSSKSLGYFYTSAGLAAYLKGKESEQGILFLGMKYFSNLISLRDYRIRNFLNINYTRGFARYSNEHLSFIAENGFSGFRNDSANGAQRVIVRVESVIFSPESYYGFRFAYFAFADASFISGTNQILGNGNILSGIGFGLRIRNDNLVINTIQLRLGFFPNLPAYSKINPFVVSGEQLLRPNTFDPGPPSIIPYR